MNMFDPTDPGAITDKDDLEVYLLTIAEEAAALLRLIDLCSGEVCSDNAEVND